jgi:penicillin-insensitive murein DD-endopeptidase
MMFQLANPIPALCVALAFVLAFAAPAGASTGEVRPMPKPSVLDRLPAKELFAGASEPARAAPTAIGSYAKGCLAGAAELEPDGPAWQAMRLSRNRNWGHPNLVELIKRLAHEARADDGWPGLLVGDLSQPRGGPMPFGHASHQIGLDADIWLTPMPKRSLTTKEREEIKPVDMVTERRDAINTKAWTEAHARLIRRAASYPEVERIFVHPPIKKQLCQWAKGDRSWLRKVRAYWGHTYHFHIRIKCPKGSANCEDQPPARPADGTGCGDELAYWMKATRWTPPKKADPNAKAPPPPPPMMLASLPRQCRAVIAE